MEKHFDLHLADGVALELILKIDDGESNGDALRVLVGWAQNNFVGEPDAITVEDEKALHLEKHFCRPKGMHLEMCLDLPMEMHYN